MIGSQPPANGGPGALSSTALPGRLHGLGAVGRVQKAWPAAATESIDPVLRAAAHQWRLNLAFADSGGTLTGDGLAALLADAKADAKSDAMADTKSDAMVHDVPETRPATPALGIAHQISQVARWIVSRHVVAFDGPAGWLLPRFQFDLALGSVRAEVAGVLAELNPVCDADAAAVWFVTPTEALGGLAPVVALNRDPATVLLAARAARERALGR